METKKTEKVKNLDLETNVELGIFPLRGQLFDDKDLRNKLLEAGILIIPNKKPYSEKDEQRKSGYGTEYTPPNYAMFILD